MRTVAKTLWIRWTRIAHAIGTFQAHLLMTVMYFLLLPPFALVARLCGDPLRVRRATTPAWLPRPPQSPTLEDGRRQFS